MAAIGCGFWAILGFAFLVPGVLLLSGFAIKGGGGGAVFWFTGCGLFCLLLTPAMYSQIDQAKEYSRLHGDYVQSRERLMAELQKIRQRDSEATE